MLRLFPLLLLPACAGGTQYERGTPTRPAPAPTMPGAGAPVVGQPGTFRPPLPRSPHQRVLPPSKEPGLWSGDGPRAALDLPELLGVSLPVPEESWFTVKDAAEDCERGLQRAIAAKGLASVAPSLPRELQTCLPLALYNLCASTLAARAIELDVPAAYDYRKWALMTEEARRERCRNIERSELFGKWYGAVSREWLRNNTR